MDSSQNIDEVAKIIQILENVVNNKVSFILISIIFGILYLATFILCLLVIVALLGDNEEGGSTYYFNGCLGSLVLLLFIPFTHRAIFYPNYRMDIITCKIQQIVSEATISMIPINGMMLAIERLAAINCQTKFERPHLISFFSMIILWIGFFIADISLQESIVMEKLYNMRFCCTSANRIEFRIYPYLVQPTIGFLIPFVTMSIVYVIFISSLLKTKSQINRTINDKRINSYGAKEPSSLISSTYSAMASDGSKTKFKKEKVKVKSPVNRSLLAVKTVLVETLIILAFYGPYQGLKIYRYYSGNDYYLIALIFKMNVVVGNFVNICMLARTNRIKNGIKGILRLKRSDSRSVSK